MPSVALQLFGEHFPPILLTETDLVSSISVLLVRPTESDLQDLAEALDLLPAPELKALAKTFHLGNSGTQKQQLVDGLLRLSRQKSLFSMASAHNNIGVVILKRFSLRHKHTRQPAEHHTHDSS